MGARRERLLRPHPHIGARTMRRMKDSIRRRNSGSRELTSDLECDVLGDCANRGRKGNRPTPIHPFSQSGAMAMKLQPRLLRGEIT